jgi:hypothetical protein
MKQQARQLPVGGAYAIAIVALIVSLAGGAYAAFHLGKNDVLSKNIKNGQVKKKDLANNAVNSDKVAVDALTGADIAELGPNDIGELTGAELPIMWAFVHTDGAIGAQSGGITLGEHTPGSGSYRLNFGTDLSNYAILATAYNSDIQIEAGICGPGGEPQTPCPGGTNNTNHADVLTEASNGTDTDSGFYVVAIP